MEGSILPVWGVLASILIIPSQKGGKKLLVAIVPLLSIKNLPIVYS
jgi:hypothetical protein